MENIGSTDIERMLGAPRTYDAVFTDKKDNSLISPSAFLTLMVAQMKNQDFLNPMDDTQFVTQMAQFSTMQQMMELAEYSKTNYAMSLVGKTVTASRFTVSGGLDTTTGIVNRVSLVDNEYVLYIAASPEDKRYLLSQVMEVHSLQTKAPEDKGGGTSGTDGAGGTGGVNGSGGTDGTGGANGASEDDDTALIDPAKADLIAGESTTNTAVVTWLAAGSPGGQTQFTVDLRADGDEYFLDIVDAKPGTESEAKYYYTVYYSRTGPFDTLARVKQGDMYGQPEQEGMQAATIVALDPGTTYYINVVVKDEKGREAVYKPAVVTTKG